MALGGALQPVPLAPLEPLPQALNPAHVAAIRLQTAPVATQERMALAPLRLTDGVPTTQLPTVCADPPAQPTALPRSKA